MCSSDLFSFSGNAFFASDIVEFTRITLIFPRDILLPPFGNTILAKLGPNFLFVLAHLLSFREIGQTGNPVLDAGQPISVRGHRLQTPDIPSLRVLAEGGPQNGLPCPSSAETIESWELPG